MQKHAPETRSKFCASSRSAGPPSVLALTAIDFPAKVMRHLRQRTGIEFYEAKIISRRKAAKTRWLKRAVT
jgi:hypothetical protein